MGSTLGYFNNYCFDDRKERLLNLLWHLVFLLQVVGVYLDILMDQEVLCLVMLASMYQYCLAQVLAGFIHVWMEVLSAWLYTKVNVEAIADNSLIELTR